MRKILRSLERQGLIYRAQLETKSKKKLAKFLKVFPKASVTLTKKRSFRAVAWMPCS